MKVYFPWKRERKRKKAGFVCVVLVFYYLAGTTLLEKRCVFSQGFPFHHRKEIKVAFMEVERVLELTSGQIKRQDMPAEPHMPQSGEHPFNISLGEEVQTQTVMFDTQRFIAIS